jgi:hypothetical protein
MIRRFGDAMETCKTARLGSQTDEKHTIHPESAIFLSSSFNPTHDEGFANWADPISWSRKVLKDPDFVKSQRKKGDFFHVWRE